MPPGVLLCCGIASKRRQGALWDQHADRRGVHQGGVRQRKAGRLRPWGGSPRRCSLGASQLQRPTQLWWVQPFFCSYLLGESSSFWLIAAAEDWKTSWLWLIKKKRVLDLCRAVAPLMHECSLWLTSVSPRLREREKEETRVSVRVFAEITKNSQQHRSCLDNDSKCASRKSALWEKIQTQPTVVKSSEDLRRGNSIYHFPWARRSALYWSLLVSHRQWFCDNLQRKYDAKSYSSFNFFVDLARKLTLFYN